MATYTCRRCGKTFSNPTGSTQVCPDCLAAQKGGKANTNTASDSPYFDADAEEPDYCQHGKLRAYCPKCR